jgi:hypothetical protein
MSIKAVKMLQEWVISGRAQLLHMMVVEPHVALVLLKTSAILQITSFLERKLII